MTYLLIDTSTPVCRMVVVGGEKTVERTWDAGRVLAKNIFGYIDEILSDSGTSYDQLTGLGVFRGPGSFTGLRIGITVANTIASARKIPIVGTTDDDWVRQAVSRLEQGDDDTIVLPEYGSEARITKPRK